jgi:hypothetical protein
MSGIIHYPLLRAQLLNAEEFKSPQALREEKRMARKRLGPKRMSQDEKVVPLVPSQILQRNSEYMKVAQAFKDEKLYCILEVKQRAYLFTVC